jgi:hypothetical protein
MRELAEGEATGELARIYEELRTYCAVPYVSSLQRHIATMPGCLEYAWAICRPAFANGRIPETAWRLSSSVPTAPFPPLSPAALRLLGVDGTGLAAIRNICDNFVRVAPINILFAAIVERLLQGVEPGGASSRQSDWEPPPSLPPMPAMTDMASLDDDGRAVLEQLATEIGGRPFVPGLYRLLAGWPGYLAHAATLIAPLLGNDSARRARAAIAERIVAVADEVLAELGSAAAGQSRPDATQADAIVSAIRTYRVTSPEMIVFGTLLRDALPQGRQGGSTCDSERRTPW